MQRVLATVMVLNRLQDVELTDVEELYLPSVEHFETALSTRKMRRSIQAFLIRDPELASSVEEAARFTLDKIEYQRENPLSAESLTLDGIVAAEEEPSCCGFGKKLNATWMRPVPHGQEPSQRYLMQ